MTLKEKFELQIVDLVEFYNFHINLFSMKNNYIF
jgi:hypothetical protein